jgi:hypothetical protein
VLYAIASHLRVPAHAYWLGLQSFVDHSQSGHVSYLFGERSLRGWWYYFPVAIAVKTPTATLLLLLISACAGLYILAAKRKTIDPTRPAARTLRSWALAAPAVLYLLVSMMSSVNIGVRHLLPIYPFVFVGVSAFVWGPLRHVWPASTPALLALAVPLQIFESANVFPDYLAFFNSPSGGSTQGPRYLLDSNIDWGQDLKKLKRYVEDNRIDSLCLAYFGSADTSYYGLNAPGVPATSEVEQRKSLDCVVAISVMHLYDMFSPPGSAEWLREKSPDARIGHSIYVYDLRKQKNAPATARAGASRRAANGATEPVTRVDGVAGTLRADPNPVPACDGKGVGKTTLFWTIDARKPVEIRVGSPDGAVVAWADASGATTTGEWVGPGTTFYLQLVGLPSEPPAKRTLAKVVAQTVTVRCP